MSKVVRKVILKLTQFSQKQLLVLGWWKMPSFKHYDSIVADGAIRSGKTTSMSLSYIEWATTNFRGQNFLICGKTIGSLRRNVVNPLKTMLYSRGYHVKDHRSDNYLEIKKNGRTNYFYLFGGNDESSQDLVQGITSAGAFFDEVALMPSSFVNQATARCSIEGSKLWFNANPSGSFHWFKVDWIDKRIEKNLLYIHFTMSDNLSLSEKTKEKYRRMYSGIFYKRYIEGLWVLSQGVVYDMFNEQEHIKETPENLNHYDYLVVSCDYGTLNPCTFGLFGIKEKSVHQIRSYYYDGRIRGIQKSDSDYAEDMVKFLGNDISKVKNIIVDPSAASFITELSKKKYGLPPVIKGKNDVISGIKLTMQYLKDNMFSMDKCCVEDTREFGCYLWDSKASERGIEQPIKSEDHCMDKIRYVIYTLFKPNADIDYSKVIERNARLNQKPMKLRTSNTF